MTMLEIAAIGTPLAVAAAAWLYVLWLLKN